MSVANRDKINCRNKNSFNNRIKLNNFQNNNYSDYYYNNNEKSSDSNFKSKYNYYKNEGNKEAINYKNNLNIDEKNTKKILKLKRILSKQKTLDKEIIPNKNINIDKSINDNNNRTTHNLRVLNKNRKINSTINENVLFNTHKKYNILLDIKNLINDDSKYVKFKKEIFEKASKKLHDKLSMVKDINIKIKKMKNLSKKFFIKKPIIAKDILNLNNNEINKEKRLIMEN